MPKLFSSERKWTRVSLRGALTALGVLATTLGIWTSSERRQARAVAEIEAIGGEVVLKKNFIPGWVEQAIGKHYFGTPTEVALNGFYWSKEKRDEPLDLERLVAAVGDMRSCRSLTISRVGLRDDDLRRLRPLADQIESLTLREIEVDHVGGSGLIHLKHWSRLKSLDINCDGFYDLDLTELATCPRLNRVSLGGGSIAEEHFQQLSRCKALKSIALFSCTFEGDWLKSLRELPRLKMLNMTNCSPRPFVGAYRILPTGEKMPIGEPTFHFRGGDPQFVPTQLFEAEFPNDGYQQWKEETLPGVEIQEMFMS